MVYRVPVVPDVRNDPKAQAAYLLEDGFLEVPEGALADKINRKGSLRVKFGVDPTAPAVTWGWSVPLRRLRRFQELGHTAVLIIGDFTAQVGDPSGRSTTRRRLTQAEVDGYVESCMASLMEILSPERLEVRRNSEWLGGMGMTEVLRLTSRATVAQLLEREDFGKRFREREPISLIEFMYPLLQGWDSVMVQADVELGGTDQLFNFMLARDLQEQEGQEAQSALCAPLLVGTDGVRKMSQSYGNYIGVAEEPQQIFGKAMSIPDEAMESYVRLALDLRPEEKERLQSELSGVKLKRRLGREMVAMFHGEDAAAEAEDAFNRVFVRHEVPTDLEVTPVSDRQLPRILIQLGWTKSTSEGRRSIQQGGVKVDGDAVKDENAELEPGKHLVQLGRRRFARVEVS